MCLFEVLIANFVINFDSKIVDFKVKVIFKFKKISFGIKKKISEFSSYSLTRVTELTSKFWINFNRNNRFIFVRLHIFSGHNMFSNVSNNLYESNIQAMSIWKLKQSIYIFKLSTCTIIDIILNINLRISWVLSNFSRAGKLVSGKLLTRTSYIRND